MSTVPGSETWRDAGLIGIDPAEAVELEREQDPLDVAASVADDGAPADLSEQIIEDPSANRDEEP